MFNYFLYRLGQSIALRLPLKLCYLIAILISDIRFVFARKDRHAVLENLKVIFPRKSAQEIRKIQVEMFRNFAKYLVDFFRFSALDKAYIEKHIRVENIRYLDDALSKQKGV